jgi:hypothetical protein
VTVTSMCKQTLCKGRHVREWEGELEERRRSTVARFGALIGPRKVLGKPAHMYIVNSWFCPANDGKSVLFDKSI